MEAAVPSSPRKQGSIRQQGSEHRPQSGLGKGHGELETEVEGVEGRANGSPFVVWSQAGKHAQQPSVREKLGGG